MSNPYEQKAREIVERVANVDVGIHRFGSAQELLDAISSALSQAVEAERAECAKIAARRAKVEWQGSHNREVDETVRRERKASAIACDYISCAIWSRSTQTETGEHS